MEKFITGIILMMCIISGTVFCKRLQRQKLEMMEMRLSTLETRSNVESQSFKGEIKAILDMIQALNISNDDDINEVGYKSDTLEDQIDEERLDKTELLAEKLIHGLKDEKAFTRRSVASIDDKIGKNKRSVENLKKTMGSELKTFHESYDDILKLMENSTNECNDKNGRLYNQIRDYTSMMNQTVAEVVLETTHLQSDIQDIQNVQHDLERNMQQNTKDINVILNMFGIQLAHQCEEQGWAHFRASCYKFIDSAANFDDAVQDCIKRKGHLTDVEDYEEQVFLTQLANNNRLWIGLTDAKEEGVYRWVHNDKIAVYTRWHDGEPNDSKQEANEDCIVSGSVWDEDSQDHWNDRACDVNIRYICKK